MLRSDYHIFDVEEAIEYGVVEAIVIQYFRFFIKMNRANNHNFYDGRTWTYNSNKAFLEYWPYLTAGQIRAVLERLKKMNVIMTGNYNANRLDQTLWYAFVNEDDFIKRLSKTANGKKPRISSISGDNDESSEISHLPSSPNADALENNSSYTVSKLTVNKESPLSGGDVPNSFSNDTYKPANDTVLRWHIRENTIYLTSNRAIATCPTTSDLLASIMSRAVPAAPNKPTGDWLVMHELKPDNVLDFKAALQAYGIVKEFHTRMSKIRPPEEYKDMREMKINESLDAARLMMTVDKRSVMLIKEVIDYLFDGPRDFWRTNLWSLAKFREKFDKIQSEMRSTPQDEDEEQKSNGPSFTILKNDQTS